MGVCCYQYEGYFATTSEELHGYIRKFELTPEQELLVQNGGQLSVVDESLLIEPAPVDAEEHEPSMAPLLESFVEELSGENE